LNGVADAAAGRPVGWLARVARLDHLAESGPRYTNRRYSAAAHRERSVMRCSRCGHEAADTDKFCAECGLFLRDAFIDHRLLHALVPESEGRHREARRELERLVEAAPDNAIANHLLGTVYFHQGTLDLAIERYERALELAPNFVLASYDLGVAHYHRGNMPEAIAAFRRCLEIDPHYNAAHYRLGIALLHAGELEQALEHFEQCTALTPEYLMARYHIGVIHERRGDLEAAAREFQRSLEEGVGEKSSQYHLERIRAARGEAG
jgi:tetratricopeptide (TPR) repeat protein